MADIANMQSIEYSIVGTVLYEPDCVGDVVAKLTPENFSSTAMRGLYEAISALHFEGNPIEPVTVSQRAGKDYEVAVREALSCYTAKSNLPYYCDLLLESRQLQAIQAEALNLAETNTLAAAQESLDRLNGIMVTKRRTEGLSAADAAVDFLRRMEAPKTEYLRWGMAELDKTLYVELGDFVVIGGYASAGKTMLSLQFAATLAEKYRVGYFSFETAQSKMYDRLMCHLAQVPLARIKQKREKLSEADWTALNTAAVELSKLNFKCHEASGWTLRDIQSVALRERYQVILVDYLQFVRDNGKGRYEQVTNISQGLHTLARTYGIAVIALSQLGRPEKESGKPKPPTLSDFRESGQIEQDADVAMLLWPSDPNDNRSRRILKVAKNKEGERLKLELEFDGARQTMVPAEPTTSEKYRALHKALRDASRNTPGQVTFTECKGDDKDLPF